MGQLSKQVIEQIALKMTEKSKKFVDACEKELKEVVTEVYAATIPAEVMKVFKTHCEYVETTQSLYVDGNGFNREDFTMTKQLPSTSGYSTKLKLTATTADQILKVKRKRDKAREDYKNLVQETESALSALRTHKNVRENLPEAAAYLPPPMSNALVVSFDSLQKRLRKQPDISKVTTP
jgi:hypothetical protein